LRHYDECEQEHYVSLSPCTGVSLDNFGRHWPLTDLENSKKLWLTIQ